MAAFPNQLPLIPPNDIWSYRNLKSLKAMITKLGLSFSRDTSSLAHRCGIYRGTKLDTWPVEQWRTAIDSLLATYNKLNPRDEALLKAYSKFYMVSPIWKPSKKEAKRIEVWEMERFLLFGRTKDGVITNDLQALRHRYAALLDSVGHKLHFALHFRRDLKQVLDTLGKVGSDPNYDWVYCHLGQLGELETAQAALAQGSHSNTAVANLVFGLACGGHLQLLEASQLDEDQYLEWILEGATAGGRIEILKRYLPPDARFARLLIQKSVKYNRSQTSLFLISHFKPLLPPTERLHLIHSAGFVGAASSTRTAQLAKFIRDVPAAHQDWDKALLECSKTPNLDVFILLVSSAPLKQLGEATLAAAAFNCRQKPPFLKLLVDAATDADVLEFIPVGLRIPK